MSDLHMSEFEDTDWDEICRSDDHIVPHPGFGHVNNHPTLGDSNKKPCREVTNIITTVDRSGSRYVHQGRDQKRSSTLSERSKMSEEDSFSNTPSDIILSSSDCDTIREASSLASDNTRSSGHGIKINNTGSIGSELCAADTILSDKNTEANNSSVSYPHDGITDTGNNLDFFENAEDKDSNDFLYYSWPEIGNFEDIDRMFRSCDSTFGLGASKEDESGWLLSADDIGGSEDVLKSDSKFPGPESKAAVNNIVKRDSSNSYSASDYGMTTSSVSYKDSSWTLEKADPYVSFENGPVVAYSKDGITPKEQINESIDQLHNQRMEGTKRHYVGNGSFSYISGLSNEVMQLSSGVSSDQPSSSEYTQEQQQTSGLDYYHLSDPALVNPTPSSVKPEVNGLPSLSKDSSHASSQLAALAGFGKGEKLHNRQDSGSSGSIKNESMAMQASTANPRSVGKPVHFSGDGFENHSDVEGVGMIVPAEFGSSNVRGSSIAGMDSMSLEAAGFRQLQLVMKQLDLRTKLCIRDSLYRLAQSAEDRHNHENFNGGYGDQRNATGPLMAEGTNKCTSFMDIETDTNPIDRSIAHLLFHRPSEPSAIPTQGSLQFKSPDVVNGSATSTPAMVENLVTREETDSEMKNVSDR